MAKERYLSDYQKNNIVHILLHMGSALLNCGAETIRVEDTLNRVGYAYGAVNMNVFVITSSIVITVEFPDGRLTTQTCRLRNTGGDTDFTRLEQLNALSREVCAAPIPPDQLDSRIRKIELSRQKQKEMLIGYILASAFFSIFFGGRWTDGIAAGFVGAFIWLLSLYLAPVCMNRVSYEFLASLLSGLLIGLLTHLIPVLNTGQIMIGDIMLLIPGVMFTNALRDILLGDTISGILRLIEAIVLTVALAFGFIVAIWVVNR